MFVYHKSYNDQDICTSNVLKETSQHCERHSRSVLLDCDTFLPTGVAAKRAARTHDFREP